MQQRQPGIPPPQQPRPQPAQQPRFTAAATTGGGVGGSDWRGHREGASRSKQRPAWMPWLGEQRGRR
eukprot:4473609-Lingulodinium_polyedra.AAC.1